MNSNQVLIPDPTQDDKVAMMEFIIASKLHLITIDGVDVSDNSIYYDEIYTYYFSNEQDALLFTLKWKK